MWCLTCGLDTSVMQDVTAAVAESRMADAAEAAEKNHLAHDGAHYPNWWPGDPGDDITAIHYHLVIALDNKHGGTRMPSGVAVADRCFTDEFHIGVQHLTRSLGELARMCPGCPNATREVCTNRACRSCTMYQRLINAEEELCELPEAMLAETGFTISTDFGDGAVVRAALSRVELSACSGIIVHTQR